MVQLSSFRINAKAVQSGQWVRVGEEYEDLEIQTRGFTDEYNDARASRLRRKAMQRGHAGDMAKLPVADVREINTDCLIEFCLLDVRNIKGDDGQPVPFAQFCELLRDPAYPDLFSATVRAVTLVGLVKAADVETASGN